MHWTLLVSRGTSIVQITYFNRNVSESDISFLWTYSNYPLSLSSQNFICLFFSLRCATGHLFPHSINNITPIRAVGEFNIKNLFQYLKLYRPFLLCGLLTKLTDATGRDLRLKNNQHWQYIFKWFIGRGVQINERKKMFVKCRTLFSTSVVPRCL